MKYRQKRAYINKIAKIKLSIKYARRNKGLKKYAEMLNADFSSSVPQNNKLSPQARTGININIPKTFRQPGGQYEFTPAGGQAYNNAYTYQIPYQTWEFGTQLPNLIKKQSPSLSMQQQLQQTQQIWNEMKQSARKADLMRWYMSNGNQKETPQAVITPYKNLTDKVQSTPYGGTAMYSRQSPLPVKGHEIGHNDHYLDVGEEEYTNSPELEAEWLASYQYLPNGMYPKLQNNPQLYRQFNNYSDYILSPAYNTYLASSKYDNSTTKADRNAALVESQNANKELDSRALSPQGQAMDDAMFSRLYDNAAEQGYKPGMGWYDDRQYDLPPAPIFDEDETYNTYKENPEYANKVSVYDKYF